MLDQDDLSKLMSLDTKKFHRSCDTVSTRDHDMLSSLSNTTGSTVLLSSERLTVMTVPSHSTTVEYVTSLTVWCSSKYRKRKEGETKERH